MKYKTLLIDGKEVGVESTRELWKKFRVTPAQLKKSGIAKKTVVRDTGAGGGVLDRYKRARDILEECGGDILMYASENCWSSKDLKRFYEKAEQERLNLSETEMRDNEVLFEQYTRARLKNLLGAEYKDIRKFASDLKNAGWTRECRVARKNRYGKFTPENTLVFRDQQFVGRIKISEEEEVEFLLKANQLEQIAFPKGENL